MVARVFGGHHGGQTGMYDVREERSLATAHAPGPPTNTLIPVSTNKFGLLFLRRMQLPGRGRQVQRVAVHI